MNKFLQNFKIQTVATLLLILFFVADSFAQKTWDRGANSNNWGDANNWNPNGVPTSGETVTIGDNYIVNINVEAVCSSLTLASGGNDITVTISGTNSLTVTNSITINNGTGNGDNRILSVGSGTLSCSSISIIDTGNNNRYSDVTLSTGIINVTGNITMGGNATRNNIVFSNTGVLNIGGTITGGGITPSTGTVNYNRSGDQTIGAYDYNNLTTSGSGNKTLTTPVNGTVSIQGTSVLVQGAADIIANTSSFILNGGTYRVDNNETVGVLTLNENSNLNLSTNSRTINFTNSSSASWTSGKMLTITGWNGNYNTGVSGNRKIFVGNNASSLTNAQLNQIRFYNGTAYFFAALLPSGELVPTAVRVGSFSPTAVCQGGTVTISGAGFTSASAVSVNGVAVSSFSVVNDNTISAVLTNTQTSGTVRVVKSGINYDSSISLTVNPIPTAVTATPSITSVCYDGSVGLTSSATLNSPSTILSENFNSPTNNWTTTNTSTGGTPANADWTLRSSGYTVCPTCGTPDVPLSSNDASQFYLSDSDRQGSGGTTRTILQSPAFSTVGLTSATLSFYHHFRDYTASNEFGYVEVSTDNTNWSSLNTYSGSTEGQPANFALATFSLNSYLNQATVYIRFRYVAPYSYYWAIDNVSVTGIPIPATYAWTSTPAGFTSAVQNPTATNQTVDRTYTVTVTNSKGCSASATTASVAIAPNTWVGTTSTAWDVATNWSCGVVPNANHNISIPTNTPNATNLNVDYTLPSGKTLTMSGTGALTIAPQSVLTIAGSANFGNRPVTVKSDATGDGMIGQVSGSLTNATNVTVERYIPSGKRAFRFLTPGVTTTDYISNNWQLATHITGSTTGANGFDATTTGGPSMYTYNNTVALGTGWTAIPSTNATNLEAGLGYRLLIRGDRTPTLITSASVPNMNTAITLSAKGTVKTGTVVVNASSTPAINGTSNTTTNGFSLVGNPYVSAVDWNAVSRSGLTDVYYAWDPNMGTAAQRGRYVTYSASTGFNNLGNSGSSNVGRYIQSGQAFFVKNTTLGTAGTLTFNESNKVGNFASVFRNQQDMSISKLGLLVYEPNELALGSLPIDGAVALFGTDFTNAIEAGDVEKLESAGENLAIFSSNQKLAMSAMAPVVEDDELLLKTLRFAANKSYTFKIEPANFDATVAAYFVDQFLNTETAIDLTQDSFVTVTTTSDVLSFGEDRFKIVFGTQQLGNPDFDKIVSLYPNPSKLNEFNLNLPNWDDTVQVNMFNSLGQQIPVSIENGDGMSKRFRVNTNLSSGVYYIKVTQNGKETTKKWIYNN